MQPITRVGTNPQATAVASHRNNQERALGTRMGTLFRACIVTVTCGTGCEMFNMLQVASVAPYLRAAEEGKEVGWIPIRIY